MKKLALLLTALGLVSAAAYAAPELTVTSVGQEVEIEHTLGSDDTTAWLYNNVGLAYGDWTFGLQGAKQWKYSDKNDDISSNNSQLQFDAWRKINDNLKLGFRYRGRNDFDRFQARYDFNYGMLWSAGDFWYQFNNNNAEDNVEMEWFPIGLKYGAFKVGYFINYGEWNNPVADAKDDKGNILTEKESFIEHQIRAYADLYKTDKLTVSTELRVTLQKEQDMVDGKEYKAWDDFGRNRLYLGASYNVTENLNVYGKYAYELGDEITKDGKAEDKHTKDYEALIFGWSYRF